MSKDTDKISNKISLPGYTFTQCAMLFIHYGLGYTMPKWVIWFPTIITLSIVLLILIIVLIGAIVE